MQWNLWVQTERGIRYVVCVILVSISKADIKPQCHTEEYEA